jgi:hypothetical protein
MERWIPNFPIRSRTGKLGMTKKDERKCWIPRPQGALNDSEEERGKLR